MADALVKRLLQLLVHGHAHFFKLLAVVLLQRLQPALHGGGEGGELRLDALHPLILHGELLFLRLGEDAVRFSDGGFELELVLLKALDQLAQADVLPLGGLCLRQRERVGKGLHGRLHGAGQLAARRAQLAGELGLECGEIGAPALAQETLIVGLALYQPQEQDKRQEREHECRGGKGKGPFIHK